MIKKILLFFIGIICLNNFAQDTTYARKVISKLCSPKFSGRGYVQNGVNKAADYLLNEMEHIGLSKVGKSYTQTYYFSVNSFPGRTSVHLNGKKLLPGVHYLIEPSSPAIKVKSRLFKIDSLTYQTKDFSSNQALTIKLKKKLTYSVATDLSNVTTIDLLKDSFPGEKNHIEVDIENRFFKAFKSQNLCGYVQGTQFPDSFVVFTAHYDHLGAMGKDAYFPGANDNASGVSMLLNLARYYKAHPAKYSVVFLFFSGEEAGLLGSKYYSEHPLFPLSTIKFLTNLDLLGTGDDGIMVVNATVFKQQFDKLKLINDNKNYLIQIKQRGKAANSDHYWFTELGVPCFFIYTMGGIQAYHDIYDRDKTLPLTKYSEVFKLLVDFTSFL